MVAGLLDLAGADAACQATLTPVWLTRRFRFSLQRNPASLTLLPSAYRTGILKDADMATSNTRSPAVRPQAA
jgi:hypothetical protein